MKYFATYEIPKHKLLPLIGEEVKNGVTGSTTYFIKSFVSDESIELLKDSKGIFQIFSNGLLLRVFKNNRTISIPIPFNQIKRLELVKGNETIQPIFFFPMWILLKVGLRIDIARYFRLRYWEYKIEATILEIETHSATFKLETNGYTFNSQEEFFAKLTDIQELKIIKPIP
ncbi:hypothetical protein [Algoriphagus aquimarinus]|uniref:hypothetical protein n=1 Tax=Algoriphagus aquimarinus TaxID=237018 RepID=UPI0030D9BB68|tara:strand:- start:343262 stop:343777 length:516 start_codon:yes stop_codon:yes gene_type:complete